MTPQLRLLVGWSVCLSRFLERAPSMLLSENGISLYQVKEYVLMLFIHKKKIKKITLFHTYKLISEYPQKD